MDKARLTTLAVLSTIFDHHEVENVEMEKSGFHISFQVQENSALDILDKKDNLTKIRDKGDGSNLQEQGHGIDQKLDLSRILGQHEIANLDMDKSGVQNNVQNGGAS